MALRDLLEAFCRPVPRGARSILEGAWGQIPAEFQTARQYLGRQYAGCGATIGLMPRCDFACRGCYLGSDSNRVPPLPLEALKEQIRELRGWLGAGGNLQLTDGEVALRDPDELVELASFARGVGLVPMLMTHGEGIRRDPHTLHRLMREAGLRELSIHIDSTQRGRRDSRFRYAENEAALMPLRDEFADLIRATRRALGTRLEVATTVTVTRENLKEVGDIVAWMVKNADAFKMVSFQPVAAVGRTEAALSASVSVEALWREVGRGLGVSAQALGASQAWFGHPACNRFLQGAVWRRAEGGARFAPLVDHGDSVDRGLQQRLLDRLGGLTFRLDSPAVAAARALGVAARNPALVLRGLPAWSRRWLRRVGESGFLRSGLALMGRRARVNYLNVVSHHFMNAAELETAVGRERLSLCTFRVAHNGRTVPMCEVNAGGLRERWNQFSRASESVRVLEHPQ